MFLTSLEIRSACLILLIPVIKIASAPNFLYKFALIIASLTELEVKASVLAIIKIPFVFLDALIAVLILFDAFFISSNFTLSVKAHIFGNT